MNFLGVYSVHSFSGQVEQVFFRELIDSEFRANLLEQARNFTIVSNLQPHPDLGPDQDLSQYLQSYFVAFETMDTVRAVVAKVSITDQEINLFFIDPKHHMNGASKFQSIVV